DRRLPPTQVPAVEQADKTLSIRLRLVPGCLPNYVARVTGAVWHGIPAPRSLRRALIVEHIQPGAAGDNDILPAVAIQIARAQSHAQADDVRRRRTAVARSEIGFEVAVRQDVSFKLSFI